MIRSEVCVRSIQPFRFWMSPFSDHFQPHTWVYDGICQTLPGEHKNRWQVAGSFPKGYSITTSRLFCKASRKTVLCTAGPQGPQSMYMGGDLGGSNPAAKTSSPKIFVHLYRWWTTVPPDDLIALCKTISVMLLPQPLVNLITSPARVFTLQMAQVWHGLTPWSDLIWSDLIIWWDLVRSGHETVSFFMSGSFP